MSREEEIWHDFSLEENCVEVSDLNRVRLYFAQFTLALDALSRVFWLNLGDKNFEGGAVDHCLSRLRETFRVLGMKHFYTGVGEELKIDTTDSGFFHFSTLTGLRADGERRKDLLTELPTTESLKRSILDRVVSYRSHPRDLQVQLARRLYLEQLDKTRIMSEFLPGSLHEVTTLETDIRSYFWSFSTYDKALNRPFVYLIYFTYERPGHALGTKDLCFTDLCDAAENIASGRTSLLAFSRMLDDTLPYISPKVVKRIILGPYHSPTFTKVPEPMDSLLTSHSDRFPFVLTWETETLLSDRETTTDASWLKKGRLRQVFWIPKNFELSSRGVSSLERFALYPYWLGQHMANTQLLDTYQRYVIDSEERVHGVN